MTPAIGTRRRRKRPRDAAATQKRLLQAAEVEFAMQGFQGARLRNIARKAGVQPALIHHYFIDKEGLYRAMLDVALAESSTLSWQILEDENDGSLEAIFTQFVDMMLAFNAKHYHLLAILRREATARSLASGLTREVIQVRLSPVIDAVAALLDERRSTGEARADLESRELILMGLALCSYPFVDRGFLEACMPHALITDDASRTARMRTIVDTLLRYAKP